MGMIMNYSNFGNNLGKFPRKNDDKTSNYEKDTLVDALVKEYLAMRRRKTIKLVWSRPATLDAVISALIPCDLFKGVYVIWYLENIYQHQTRRVVKVGQGSIRSRLQAYRNFAQRGFGGTVLYATWAIVPSDNDLDGVENYVGNRYVLGGIFPKTDPIIVNLPW